MLLENRTAVIYGGGGKIGGALAKGFAAEGARSVIVGRTASTQVNISCGAHGD